MFRVSTGAPQGHRGLGTIPKYSKGWKRGRPGCFQGFQGVYFSFVAVIFEMTKLEVLISGADVRREAANK
jgi:hypothetical protein